jgi:hypothetical protein
MKFFSDCSGECVDCSAYYVAANCLAGHGDDHYSPIDPNIAKQILSDGVLYKGEKGPLYHERLLREDEKSHLMKACNIKL